MLSTDVVAVRAPLNATEQWSASPKVLDVYIKGHETCTHNISHTSCMIRLPFTTMNSTIGSMAARINT